ncbi:MAG: hypothetical protein AAGM84_14875 [Pseudomonadota bacterium]
MRAVLSFAFCLWVALAAAAAADITRFIGDYSGAAEVDLGDGTLQARDMSVRIFETEDGFGVQWSTTRLRSSGKSKTTSYEVRFLPTQRPGVYAAAQKKNVFGHEVPLDPMQGEPYVWARLIDDTLSVYSLFVTDDGSYEMQQYDRTLVADGLALDFRRFAEGVQLRSVKTVLVRD